MANLAQAKHDILVKRGVIEAEPEASVEEEVVSEEVVSDELAAETLASTEEDSA